MFSSSSLSSLSSFPLNEEFAPRHVETIRVIDALWALETVEGGKASAAYIVAMPEMARRKMCNALKEQIDNCNRHDHRTSLISLWLAFANSK